MRVIGNVKPDTQSNGSFDLESLAIIAPPETIRALAKFFNAAADEMDELGDDYDHVHLMDEWKGWLDSYPDFQILSKKYL